MCRRLLPQAILFLVVCLMIAESTNLFTCGPFNFSDADISFSGSNACLPEVEQEFDQDGLEMKGLTASLATCVEEYVQVTGLANCCDLTSQVLSVSRWHLRGPPLV